MAYDIGRGILFIALLVAAFTAVAPVVSVKRDKPLLMEATRNAQILLAALLTAATAVLLTALYTHDFTLKYVADYTSRDLPWFYSLSAWWAGQEGSLTLWVWVLSLMGVAVFWQNRKKNAELMPYVAAIIGVVQVFFMWLINFVTPLFATNPSPPFDGSGLNPLLQNYGMVFHPTTLYLGYVAFTIPFAFAMAALITGRLGTVWIRTTRRWTLFAWFFLGAGILFGAQWAYVELGWGGYWAWDPVESASLMPWLVGTAFLHSVMIQERRGMLKVWNMVLIIVTFSLSLFGTFLTRSGILSSVHAFSQGPLGYYFLAFILITLLASFRWLGLRIEDLKSDNEFDSFISRESTFLVNNLILVGSAFAVFWGTVFPLISEAVRGVKVTVGPPFFNQVNAPIYLLLILIVGVCPLIGWARATRENLLRNFLKPCAGTAVVTVALFALGVRRWTALLAFSICAFVILAILMEFYRGVAAKRRASGDNWLVAFARLVWGNKRRYGGYIVHLAVIVIAIGVTGSQLYNVQKEVSLNPGETATIGNYRLRYDDLSSFQTQSKNVVTATMSIFDATSGEAIGTVYPEKDKFPNQDNPTTEVAIRSTAKEDLYIILSGWSTNKLASFKFVVNPLVIWIWLGALGALLGSVIAFWPDAKEQRRLAIITERELATDAA